MNNPADLVGWPEGSACLVISSESPEVPLLSAGDAAAVRPWASVSKVAVAWAMARGVERGSVDLAAAAGPEGSTVAHLLAHASGLGLEAGDPTMAVGVRRIYSNIGIDTAVAVVTRDGDPAEWMRDEVLRPLAMETTRLTGRPAAGVQGSLEDLARLGRAWLAGHELSDAVRATFTEPFLPDLVGVVPGFGRFSPCPWGLGVELHGDKNHWMGQRFSPRSYGHFGQSGSLLLVDPDRDVVVAACAGAPFGPWATALWPTWMDDVAALCPLT